jgi:hypothetical protein
MEIIQGDHTNKSLAELTSKIPAHMQWNAKYWTKGVEKTFLNPQKALDMGSATHYWIENEKLPCNRHLKLLRE